MFYILFLTKFLCSVYVPKSVSLHLAIPFVYDIPKLCPLFRYTVFALLFSYMFIISCINKEMPVSYRKDTLELSFQHYLRAFFDHLLS